MQVKSIVIGKQSHKNDFITALKTCEEKKKISPHSIAYEQIKFLPEVKRGLSIGRAKNFDLEAQEIKKALNEAERTVIVDAEAFDNALAIISQYKNAWNISDEVVEKLFLIVYDKDNPQRAEVVQDIKEAFRLLEKFDRENKTLFLTAIGHTYNFAMDLSAKKNSLEVDLPPFEKIVEIDPANAFQFIRSAIATGKAVFVHETLLSKNPTVKFMSSSLTESQKDRLNFIKARNKI